MCCLAQHEQLPVDKLLIIMNHTPIFLKSNFNVFFILLLACWTPLSILAVNSVSTADFDSGGDTCITDTIPPIFTNCPENIVKTPNSSNNCWTISWAALAATDNFGTPTMIQTSGPTNGSCLAVGSYGVTYKATDTKDNTATCSFTITVYDCLNYNTIYDEAPVEGDNRYTYLDGTSKIAD
jgi:HYR domain